MIHTSDWHLGRSFHGVGLLDAQARFLDDLVDVVRVERVEAVLVSGDIYDRALPAPETVDVLSTALTRLVEAGAQVILTSGNHDSAPRLGFASGLLDRAGVHIRTSLARLGTPVPVGDGWVYPLPYLEPSVAADPLAADGRTHADVVRAALRRVGSDAARRSGPTVVMAHAFVAGAVASGSERDISVGGVSLVPTEAFAGADYVALGHLHGAQSVSDRVRYSGSPQALSFGEAGQVKGSWLVDLAGGSVAAAWVPAPVSRPLAVLRGELEELLRARELIGAESAWCQVTLTDAVRPSGALEALRRRFPHTLELKFAPVGAVVSVSRYAARQVHTRTELEVCTEFLTHVRGGAAATDAEQALLAHAVEASRVARGERDDEGRVAGHARGVA
jgi:exonuclease SbcD